MSADKNALCTQRTNLRKQFMEGRTLRKVPFENDKWYKDNDADLLDVHYKCDKNTALADAFYMLRTEIPRISVKERTTQQKRAKLDPCEPPIIQEWYDNKNDELESGPDGESYKTEREEREHRVQQQVQAQQLDGKVGAS